MGMYTLLTRNLIFIVISRFDIHLYHKILNFFSVILNQLNGYCGIYQIIVFVPEVCFLHISSLEMKLVTLIVAKIETFDTHSP